MKLDPDPILRWLEGYRASALVRAAIELDLFTPLPGTAGTVASHAACPVRGVRMTLDALAALGLIRKSGTRYVHTPHSRTFLARRSPKFMGDVAKLFVHPQMWNAWLHVADAVRAGRSVLARDAHAEGQEFWLDYARVTARHARVWAEALTKMVPVRSGLRVLDVACGSGVYGLTFAKRGAEVTLLDQAYVLDETRRVARAMGVTPRYLAGDVFKTEWGGPYDVVILSHILHHFDRAACIDLLTRAREALAPGGTLAVQEFVPDDARRTRLRPLMFAVTMLLWTRAGDAYTWRELRAMLREVGFRGAKMLGLEDPRQVILARRA